MTAKPKWTNDAILTISRAYHQDGLSASAVSTLYDGKLDGGRALTSNAVIGLMNRNKTKLSVPTTSRRQYNTRPALPRQPRAARPVRHASAVPVSANTTPQKPAGNLQETVREPKIEIPVSLHITTDFLAKGQCAFVTDLRDDGVSLHCGNQCPQRVNGQAFKKYRSYCQGHENLCSHPDAAKKGKAFQRQVKWLSQVSA